MKKVIALFLILLISIPFFAISASAAEYELIGPSILNYDDVSGRDRTFPYFGRYGYVDIEGQRFWRYSSLGFQNLIYMDPSGYIFDLGGPFPGDNYFVNTVRSPFSSSDSGVLAAYYHSGYSNYLMFASFVYQGIMLPETGQFLKISLEFDAYLPNVPSSFNYLLNPKHFCFLCDDYGAPGTSDKFSLPKLTPSAITSSINKQGFVHYDFYFNYSDIDSSLFSSQNICLGIRIPYYLPSDGSLLDSTIFYSATNLPTSYEILTVGGYDEQLSNIENAIYVSNQTLIDLYTNPSDTDLVHVIEFEQDNVQLDNTINDYKESESKIEDIDNAIVLPPLNDAFNENVLSDLQLPDFGNLSILWNDLITEMLIVVLTLGTFAVILYGKRI